MAVKFDFSNLPSGFMDHQKALMDIDEYLAHISMTITNLQYRIAELESQVKFLKEKNGE